jgi:superfamily II DNA or RNA helicase
LKLLPYQIPHAERILKALHTHGLAIDGSDPGVGKTYVAAAVAHETRVPVLVICPKVSIPVWKRVLNGFDVRAVDVLNYEKLRTGKTPNGRWNERKQFEWTIPDDALIIFDEVHRCKAKDSQNAKMLKDAKGRRVLLLSATLAENPMELRAVAHVTGLSDWHGFWSWLLRHGCKKGRFGMQFDKNRADVLAKLHHELFVERGSRLKIAELGDQFPETQITAEAMDFGDEIEDIYKEMEAELAALDEAAANDKPAQQLTIQLRARQAVELCKVPGIVSLAEDFLQEGKSVVIFTNFRATLEALCNKLNTTCAIYGEQPASWRQKCIDDFQSNLQRVIVVNIQAGGVSVSLHDTLGTHPRVALVCPTYSGTELRQALGRVHRSGGTKSLQRILFAAGSVEEKVCVRVNAKLERMDLLNDGLPLFSDTDLDPLKNNLNESSNEGSKAQSGLMQTHMTAQTTEQKTLEHSDRAHSKHSPSSLENKAKCPGWFNDPDPTRDRSAADRGSLGHEMVEKENFDMAGDDLELTDAAVTCWKFMQKFDRPGTVHHKEIRLAIQNQFGHLDHLYIHTDGTADLIDLKFARNIYGADTAQFWAYMIGAWDRFSEIQTIRVWVLHPFLDHIDSETYTRENDYDRLNATIRMIIHRAENPNPDQFQIGKQCTYCGRLSICTKWAEFGVEIANRYAEDGKKYQLPSGSVHGTDIEDPQTLAILWRIAPLVQKAAGGWRKAALEKRMEGEDIPGLELYEKAGAREITNAAAAFEAISDRVKPEDFIHACDVKITDLEKIFADSFPRGEKGKSKKELMSRLTDASAISSGAPQQLLRELK